MNLLKFAWATARLPFVAIPTVFGGASLNVLSDGDIAAGLALLFAGAALFMGYLLGCAGHRRNLDRINAKAYVRKIIHNANEGLPKEQVAVDYVAWLFKHPIH